MPTGAEDRPMGDTHHLMDAAMMVMDDVWPSFQLRGVQEDVVQMLLVEQKSA